MTNFKRPLLFKQSILLIIFIFSVNCLFSQRYHKWVNQIGAHEQTFQKSKSILYTPILELNKEENQLVLDSISAWYPNHNVTMVGELTSDHEGVPAFSTFSISQMGFTVWVKYLCLSELNSSLEKNILVSSAASGYTPPSVLLYLPLNMDTDSASFINRILITYKAFKHIASEKDYWKLGKLKHRAGCTKEASEILKKDTLLMNKSDILDSMSMIELKNIYPNELKFVDQTTFNKLINERAKGYVYLDRVEFNKSNQDDLNSYSLIQLSSGKPLMGMWAWSTGNTIYTNSPLITADLIRRMNKIYHAIQGKYLF